MNIDDKKNVKTYMIAAAGVIMKEGDNGEKMILLIQRAKKDRWPLHYEFPRGKCDKSPNEKILDCLKREVKEETGLDVIPIKFIDKFKYLAEKGTRLTTCYNYLCKMKDEDQKVKLSDEHDDFKWIKEVGEAELMALPDQKTTIEKVLNTERSITMEPENTFTNDEPLEEYLNFIYLKEDYKNHLKEHNVILSEFDFKVIWKHLMQTKADVNYEKWKKSIEVLHQRMRDIKAGKPTDSSLDKFLDNDFLTPLHRMDANDVQKALDWRKWWGWHDGGQIMGHIPNWAVYVSYAALVAMAGYAAKKIYLRYFSKAANGCKNTSGSERTKCINKYRIKAYEEAIKGLKVAMNACSKNKNADKCKTKVQNKINKYKKKIGKLSK